MSKRVLCAVLVPMMVLGVWAPAVARAAGQQAFITSAAPLSQAEMDHYSQQQTDADQTKLLCQGGDDGNARQIVIIAVMVGIIVAVNLALWY